MNDDATSERRRNESNLLGLQIFDSSPIIVTLSATLSRFGPSLNSWLSLSCYRASEEKSVEASSHPMLLGKECEDEFDQLFPHMRDRVGG